MSGSEMHEDSGVACGPDSRPADGGAQEGVSTPAGASIPNAIDEGQRLVALCEAGTDAERWGVLYAAATYLNALSPGVATFLDVDAYTEAAIAMLPAGAIWRKYTDESCSVYAASPYSAKAQVRYDGSNRVPSLALTAANLRMRLAPLLRAQAIEARRAATAKTGAVEDESAVPEGCAQGEQP